MSTQIGQLVIDMTANIARIQKDMAAAKSTVNSAMNAIKGASQSASNAIASIGVGFSAAAIVSQIDRIAQGLDALNDAADATGASVELLAQLERAAVKSGGSFETVTSALMKFNMSLAEAEGEDKVSVVLSSIGLEAQKIKDADPAQALYEVAKAFEGYADNGEKARAMQALFGKSAKEVAPLLKDLVEKGLEASDSIEAQTLAADQYVKALGNAKQAINEAARAGFTELSPMLTTIIKAFSELTSGGKIVETMFIGMGKLMGSAAIAAANLGHSFWVVGTSLGAMAAATAAAAKGDFAAAKNIMVMAGEDIQRANVKLSAFENQVGAVTKNLGNLYKATGKVGFDDTRKSVGDINAKVAALKSLGAANAKAAAEEEKRAAKVRELIDGIKKQTAVELEEIRIGEQLTDGQKKALEIMLDIQQGKLQLTDAEKALLSVTLEAYLTEEKRVDAQRKLNDERKKAIEDAKKGAEAEDKNIEKMREEAEEIGKTAKEVAALRAQRLLDAAAKRDIAAADASAGEELKKYLAAQSEALKQQAALTQEMESKRSTASYTEQLKALKLETEEIGLTAEALADLKVKRLNDAAAMLEQQAAAGGQDYLNEEAEAIRKVADELVTLEAKKAAVKAADDAEKEWQKMFDDLGAALSNAIMSGGKNAGQLLKNYFKGLVLQPVIKAIANPIAGALLSGLGFGPGAASAAGGGAAAAGGSSAIGTVGGLAGLASFAGALGGAFSGGMAATLAGGFASTSLAISGGMSAIAAGTATSIGVGMASIAGALGPYALAAMAVYALYKKLDRSGTPHVGADAISDGTITRNANDYEVGRFAYGYGFNGGKVQAVEDAMRALTSGAATTLNALDKAYGAGRVFTVGAGFAADGVDNALANIAISVNGIKTVQRDIEALPSSAEEALPKFTSMFAAELRATVLAMNLPEYARKAFEALGDNATIDQFAQTAAAVAQVREAAEALRKTLDGLPGALGQVALLSEDMRVKFAELFGGLPNAGQAIGGYFEKFYTEAEKRAKTSSDLLSFFNSIGVSEVPRNTKAFRALVDAQDLSTEAGKAAAAQLIKLSAGFAELVEKQETALRDAYSRESGELRDLISSLDDAGKSIGDFIRSLNGQIAGLGGASLAYAQAEYSRVIARIRSGDLSAVGDLSSAGDALAEQSVNGATTSLEAARLIARIREQARGAQASVSRQKSAAEMNLDLLNRQVSALIDIDESVESVREILARIYGESPRVLGGVDARPRDTFETPQADVSSNPMADQQANAANSNAAAQAINADLILEVRALRAELEMSRAEERSTAVSARKIADLLDRATDGGQDYLLTKAAQ